MQEPVDYSNLFLDMNAFFASVEQQVQPTLRGKPVCVAPYTGNTGCCIAKSYEAKAFGVGTGSLVGEAKKACPSIIIVESRPELYMFYHREILKVLKNFSPFVQVCSVDEFNIKLTGSDRNIEKAKNMALGLKKAIREEVGDYLMCSIGISSSYWLAKVAGELKKPDGLVALKLEELGALYRTLELRDLPGINYGMERQLHRKKIKTPFDFYESSLFNLSRWFGQVGRVWFYRLRGYEIDEIRSSTKSVGHSHVLAPVYRNKKDARRVLAKMAAKCATRLRAKDLFASGVAVAVKFLEGPVWRKCATIDLSADSRTIQRAALALYDECYSFRAPLRLSVTTFNLKKIQGYQISLFAENEKSRRVSETLDAINDKFGENTIYPASMFDTLEAAPNRIPFGDPGRLSF